MGQKKPNQHGALLHTYTPCYTCFNAFVPLCMCTSVCLLPGGEVVQTSGDVLAVVVNLFRVEGALAVKAVQCVFELHQLSLPSLSVQTLMTDILQRG